jgi:hypothetical protein
MSWWNVTGTLDDSSKARFHARASADMAFIPAVYR